LLILEINRDYPYQVALSFDEAAMDVLDWLESCEFEVRSRSSRELIHT
jgi:hypothetical protein